MTHRPQALVAHAFGKLFILGEYAVVEPGEPAIVVGVNRGITASLTRREHTVGGTVHDLNYGPDPVAWQPLIDDDAGHAHTVGVEFLGRDADHATTALGVVEEWRAVHGLAPLGYDIEISSELQDEIGTKYGLGSSGAVTVALIMVAGEAYGLQLSLEQVFRLAMLATIDRSPAASGGDLAASIWGGWLRYCAPDRQRLAAVRRTLGLKAAMQDTAAWGSFEASPLPAPSHVQLAVGWTQSPASTDDLVSTLQPRVDETFLASNRRVVESFVQALTHPNQPGGQAQAPEAIAQGGKLLQTLSEAGERSVLTPKLQKLIESAVACGAQAKPSGAGGGDCGIVLAPHDLQLDAMFAAWSSNEIQRLNIHVVDRPTGSSADSVPLRESRTLA